METVISRQFGRERLASYGWREYLKLLFPSLAHAHASIWLACGIGVAEGEKASRWFEWEEPLVLGCLWYVLSLAGEIHERLFCRILRRIML